jgi:c-di-AMP phosphodiesterase-like protein
LYFDIFSLWIAPISLDVEEEAFIRIMRYFRYLMFICIVIIVVAFFVSSFNSCIHYFFNFLKLILFTLTHSHSYTRTHTRRYYQDVRSTCNRIESGSWILDLHSELLQSQHRGTINCY